MQKLADEYKNQSDVLFLSFNTDDDPGLIDPFVKDQELTITVIPAYSYAADTLKVYLLPQNWIVAPDGIVRLKGTGYDATEKWETGVKNAIDQFRRPAAAKSSRADLSSIHRAVYLRRTRSFPETGPCHFLDTPPPRC